MKAIKKNQPTSGADLAKASVGQPSMRLEIIDPRTMEEIHVAAPPGVPMAPAPVAAEEPPAAPEPAAEEDTILVCDEEGGPPPEATQQMDAEFLQSIIEHIVSTGDAVSPFHEKDHQCYMFALTSLNDGELRQYDGTLNEIWKVLLADVKRILKESGLTEECQALVMGDDPSFEMLLTA
jgi:hypothetical protein